MKHIKNFLWLFLSYVFLALLIVFWIYASFQLAVFSLNLLAEGGVYLYLHPKSFIGVCLFIVSIAILTVTIDHRLKAGAFIKPNTCGAINTDEMMLTARKARYLSDWVTYYIMPFAKRGVGANFSFNSFGEHNEVLPISTAAGLLLTCEKINDLSGHNLVRVYYEWLSGPWFYFRICSDNLFFTRFRHFFSKTILVNYRTENVRYRIVKKNYSKGEFLLAGEDGGDQFRFLQDGYNREGPFTESSFKVEFRYKTEAEKFFFLGLALCIPTAMDAAEPSGGT